MRSIYRANGEKQSILSPFQKGQELPKGFKPKEDTPNYQNKTYRFTPSKTVRGYEKPLQNIHMKYTKCISVVVVKY